MPGCNGIGGDLDDFGNSVGSIEILMFFSGDWCQNHSKTWSGGRFFNIAR